MEHIALEENPDTKEEEMKEETWLHRLLMKLFKKLGIVETREISKEEMCKKAQSICDHNCDGCAWNNKEE